MPLGRHSRRGADRYVKYKFTVKDFRVLFGMRTEAAVRAAIQRGKFDPADLESVVAFYEERRGKG